MFRYLITGAGRGIGLELARQLVQLGPSQVATVFATTRGEPSKELCELISASSGRLVHVTCEATNQSSVERAVATIEAAVGSNGLDVLVNNIGTAGPWSPDGLASVSTDQLSEVFNVNVVTAHRMIAAALPLLQRGKQRTIINMSSSMGSMTLAANLAGAPQHVYKISKTAMNSMTVQYAMDLEKENFTVVSISPGWLKTDLGSQYADLDVATGVKAVVELIQKLDRSANGKFLNIHVPGWEKAEGRNQYAGGELPW